MRKVLKKKAGKRSKYLWFSILISFFLILTMRLSYAQAPEYTEAVFGDYRDSETVKVRPNGLPPGISPDEHGNMISDNQSSDTLWVAGGDSWAHLSFQDNQGGLLNPLVKIGGVQTETVFGFPCWVKQLGSGVFGWGFENVNNACTTVIANVDIAENTLISSKSSPREIANGELNSRQITITRIDEKTLIRVYRSDRKVIVDVFIGAVKVLALSGQEFNVDSNNRFIQSENTESLELIDLQETTEFSMEDFLDEANWSSEVEPLLNQLRAQSPGFSEPSIQLTEVEQAILDTHNDCRDEVNIPPLSWSVELASIAQDWANTLSGERNLRHRPGISGSGAGENIAAGSSIEIMLDLWKEEKKDYDPSTGQCRSGKTCGHYTQMVWRNTTEVGCGVASHRRYGNVMICNYRPPGNFIGQRPY